MLVGCGSVVASPLGPQTLDRQRLYFSFSLHVLRLGTTKNVVANDTGCDTMLGMFAFRTKRSKLALIDIDEAPPTRLSVLQQVHSPPSHPNQRSYNTLSCTNHVQSIL